MFFALHDTLPLRRLRVAYVTYALLVINVLIFVAFESGLVLSLEPEFSAGFGLIPSVLMGTEALPAYVAHAPAGITPVTALFLHGGWAHLASNMLFLQVFGNNVEDAMGHLRFAVFYLLTGALSGLAYAFANPASEAPLIGASGAISGVLAAYMLLNPRALVFGLLFGLVPMRLPAIWAVGTWIIYQLGQALLNADHSVAFVAHVAGFISGMALLVVFKHRDVTLFSDAS